MRPCAMTSASRASACATAWASRCASTCSRARATRALALSTPACAAANCSRSCPTRAAASSAACVAAPRCPLVASAGAADAVPGWPTMPTVTATPTAPTRPAHRRRRGVPAPTNSSTARLSRRSTSSDPRSTHRGDCLRAHRTDPHTGWSRWRGPTAPVRAHETVIGRSRSCLDGAHHFLDPRRAPVPVTAAARRAGPGVRGWSGGPAHEQGDHPDGGRRPHGPAGDHPRPACPVRVRLPDRRARPPARRPWPCWPNWPCGCGRSR